MRAYSAVRKTQKIADQLVLGHEHMYAELTQASQIQLLQIFKSDCNLNSDSVFVDLGCGLGKNGVFSVCMWGSKKHWY